MNVFIVSRIRLSTLLLCLGLTGCASSSYDPCVHGFYSGDLLSWVMAEAMEAAICSDDSTPQSATLQVQPITDRYGRTYDTDEEFLEETRAINAQMLREIRPLPSPLAPLALVVLPTEILIRDRADDWYTGPEQYRTHPEVVGRVNTHFEYNKFVIAQFPELLRVRQIFEKVETTRADHPGGLEANPSGFIIWFEKAKKGDLFHIRRTGATDFTQLPVNYWEGKDEHDSVNILLDEIEGFVRNNKQTVGIVRPALVSQIGSVQTGQIASTKTSVALSRQTLRSSAIDAVDVFF